jgi:hypothetical protein
MPLVANVEPNANNEYPPSSGDGVNAAAHAGNSEEDPPVANRHTLVTDEAPWRDNYFGRAQQAGARPTAHPHVLFGRLDRVSTDRDVLPAESHAWNLQKCMLRFLQTIIALFFPSRLWSRLAAHFTR